MKYLKEICKRKARARTALVLLLALISACLCVGLVGNSYSSPVVIVIGLSVGSFAALFMGVGGGIFTKTERVHADLVGKVDAGLNEPLTVNPYLIEIWLNQERPARAESTRVLLMVVDNVGDNVGDCAGMAADVFDSYEVSLVAAIVLGATTAVVSKLRDLFGLRALSYIVGAMRSWAAMLIADLVEIIMFVRSRGVGRAGMPVSLAIASLSALVGIVQLDAGPPSFTLYLTVGALLGSVVAYRSVTQSIVTGAPAHASRVPRGETLVVLCSSKTQREAHHSPSRILDFRKNMKEATVVLCAAMAQRLAVVESDLRFWWETRTAGHHFGRQGGTLAGI